MSRVIFVIIWVLFLYGLLCYLWSLRRYGGRFVEQSIMYDLYTQMDNLVNNYDGTMSVINSSGKIHPYKVYIRGWDFVSPYIIAFKRYVPEPGDGEKGQETIYYRRVVIFSSLYFKIRGKK